MIKNDDANTSQLIELYGLTYDPVAERYTAMTGPGAHSLLVHTIEHASRAMLKYGTAPYLFSDDDTDYINAIRDQLNITTDLMIADDSSPATLATALLDMLNYDDADWHEPCPGQSFLYGYADHTSSFSELLILNRRQA